MPDAKLAGIAVLDLLKGVDAWMREPGRLGRRQVADTYAVLILQLMGATAVMTPSFPTLSTLHDPHTEKAQEYRAAMEAVVADLEMKIDTAAGGGPERMRQKHLSRGKLLPRQRVERLLDPGTPFLELSPLAAHGMYDDPAPAAGIITGIGRVSGRECVIVCNDATVKGGTYYPMTVKKHVRAQEIARENHLPCIYLVDSGGAFLPLWDDVFPDRDHFGRIFYNQATLSGLGIPQIACVMGMCTAGGAYMPAMSDETVIVRRQGTIYLGGPAAGEVGHRRRRRPRRSWAAPTSTPAPPASSTTTPSTTPTPCRSCATSSPPSNPEKRSRRAWRNPRSPSTTPGSCTRSCPPDTRIPYDVHEIIARLVDGSRFHEFKALYATTIVCGFAHIMGFPVGIVANNGILFSESSLKAAHFIELCNQRKIPLVFLQNISGFMVGADVEAGGIAKDGAKMVTAVSCSVVPKFTVVIGGSFGAGNYAMCGRGYSPRFLWMWPNARLSVMGGEQAASVLATVKQGGFASKEEEEAFKQPIRDQYDRQGHPYYTTARLWDDGVIDPLDTRLTLALAISASYNAPIPEPNYGVFRM